MAKNIVQDVLPPEKKTIRNIPIPDRRGKVKKEEIFRDVVAEKNDDEEIHLNNDGEEKKSGSRLVIWSVATISILVAFVAITSIFFVKAHISITPKQELVSLNSVFTASGEMNDGSLDYKVIKVEKSLGENVDASGSVRVEEKASGTIVVYNNWSTDPQKLIANTRFESPNGLVYRINKAISVPGKKTEGGKTVPGSIEVVVYADESGEKYNIGLVDFTLPGLKGDARYKDVYARSKTSMTGGFSGMIKKITDSDKARVKQEISDKLSPELSSDAIAQIPEGYLLLNGASFIDLEELPQSDVKDDSVTYNLKGTLYAVALNSNLLSEEISKKIFSNESTGTVEILHMDTLVFAVQQDDIIKSVANSLVPITFTLKGDVLGVWKFDENEIKNILSGQPKKSLIPILSSYPQIEEAKMSLRPFWLTRFPKNADKIEIKRIVEEK